MLTSLDRVPQVPHGRALGTDVVGSAQLCNLVVALVLLAIDQGRELVELEVVLALSVAVVGLCLLVLLLGVHDVVHLGAVLVLQDLVAVHVVEDLTALATHVLGHLLTHVIHLLGDFVLRILLSLVVKLEGERELGKLDVCVEIIQPLKI